MKIGILTFHTAKNIGAQLQAYALFYTLRKYNHDVEFVRYEPSYLSAPYSFLRNARIKNGIASYVKQCILHVFFDTKTWLKTIRHYKVFQNQYLRFSEKKYYKPNELLISKYDAIIVGSDQIWNPEITNGCVDGMYTLAFDSGRIRKISYAASFSISHITKGNTQVLIKRLQSFSSISVREKSLKSYLESFSNLHIDVVIDPTLLLSKEEWLNLMPQKRIIKKRYVLLYQARGNKKAIYDKAKELADKIGVDVYDASGMNYRIKKNNVQYVNPIEFLNLVYYAEAVVTVSFHGTALSVILEKPFYSIRLNDGRDGRVEDLLNTVGLETQLKSIDEELGIPTIYYNEAKDVLCRLRLNSLSFLHKALNC